MGYLQIQLMNTLTYFDFGTDINYSFLTTQGYSAKGNRSFKLVSKYSSHSMVII